MPFLRQKFATYHEFATASLTDIYTQNCLDDSLQLTATVAESGLLINEGDGFRFQPFPRLAQNSPAFGIQFVHANADGIIDLVLAQNFFSPQRETGRMDGGLSWLLYGNGDGTYQPVWPSDSGIAIAGDVKSLIRTDLNYDGWDDLVFATNDGPAKAYLHRGESNGLLQISLEGPTGNQNCVGGRLNVVRKAGSEIIEIHANSGYLSQNSGPVLIPSPKANPVQKIDFTFANGQTRQVEIESERAITIRP